MNLSSGIATFGNLSINRSGTGYKDGEWNVPAGKVDGRETYAAAAVFYVHGVLADPLLQNRPVDFIDAEKVYIEGCLLLAAAATVWRFRARRRRRVAIAGRR